MSARKCVSSLCALLLILGVAGCQNQRNEAGTGGEKGGVTDTLLKPDTLGVDTGRIRKDVDSLIHDSTLNGSNLKKKGSTSR